MLRRIILVFSILIFSSVLSDKYGLPEEEPGASEDYIIEVEEPNQKEEVPREFDATGKVIISRKEKISDDICLVSLIRPATNPRYYIKSKVKFDLKNFRQVKAGYENDWKSHLSVGAPNDYGRKFYVYFFLLREKFFKEIEDMDNKSEEEGIEREEFESKFLSYSNKYHTNSAPITIYRKFPDIKQQK